MKPEQLAYIAGFIDGEGCISLAKRGKYITPSLQISNTDYDILEWIGGFYGLKVYDKIADRRPTRKPSYRLAVFGDKAIQILKDILPYLRVKKEQAEVVLGLNRAASQRDSLGRLSRSITPEIAADNHNRLTRIRFLNRRGALTFSR